MQCKSPIIWDRIARSSSRRALRLLKLLRVRSQCLLWGKSRHVRVQLAMSALEMKSSSEDHHHMLRKLSANEIQTPP